VNGRFFVRNLTSSRREPKAGPFTHAETKWRASRLGAGPGSAVVALAAFRRASVEPAPRTPGVGTAGPRSILAVPRDSRHRGRARIDPDRGPILITTAGPVAGNLVGHAQLDHHARDEQARRRDRHSLVNGRWSRWCSWGSVAAVDLAYRAGQPAGVRNTSSGASSAAAATFAVLARARSGGWNAVGCLGECRDPISSAPSSRSAAADGLAFELLDAARRRGRSQPRSGG